MANIKKGFPYFGMQTDRYQDRKIKKLKKALGPTSVAVYDYIVCEIYREEGSYMIWDEDAIFDVAEYWGLEENQVKNIIDFCCSIGLFNRELLDVDKMLTSQEIIQEYQEMCKRTRRTKVNLPEKLALILEEPGLFTEESPQTAEESGENTGSSPIKKERKKEKKEKESAHSSVDPEIIKNSWNEFALMNDLSQIRGLNKSRLKHVNQRLNEKEFDLDEIFEKIKQSKFLLGMNERGWKADFDFVFSSANNYLKILEGKYDTSKNGNTVNRANSTGTSGSNGKSGTGGFKYFNPETQEYES